MSFMKVTGCGCLGADPTLRTTQAGLNIAEFRMAWDTGYGDNKQANWITCICFGKLAETAMRYLSKGIFTAIDGELQIDQWKDKETGQPRSSPKITVQKIHFMPNTKTGGDGGGGGQYQQQGGGGYQQANMGRQPQQQQQQAPPQFGGGGAQQQAHSIGNDDVPF